MDIPLTSIRSQSSLIPIDVSAFSTCRLIQGTIDHYFKKDRVIGEGGFGEVYTAFVLPTGKTLHTEMPNYVAIKSIQIREDTDFETLRNEIDVLKMVTQNHLVYGVKYYGCLVKGDRIYIVMEYINGHNLDTILFKEPVLPGMPFLSKEKLNYIARQILAAIKELHSLNIAHRDIKIENIILLPDGRIKLLDYGLSCALTYNKNAIGCVNDVGTLGYQDEKLIPGDLESMKSADMWAFGQILVILFLNRYWGTYNPIRQHYMNVPDEALAGLPVKLKRFIKNLTNTKTEQKDRFKIEQINL